MSTDLPQYGIKTCGKQLDPPFDALGPCLLEPGHDDLCMVQAPGIRGGRMSIREVAGPLPQLKDHPWYSDEEVLRYRRTSRRLFRGSMAAFALNMLVCAWTLLRAFHVL